MQNRPTAAELIEAVAEFLSRDVAPELEGRTAFHLRVALNVLATVGREIEQGDAADRAEQARLADLLGRDAPLEDLVAQAATAIRNGSLSPGTPALLAHLRHSVEDKLAIANPNYLAAAKRVEAGDGG